ncbi:MAG: hypothetical protein ACYC21_13945 [Eubacteriales bacterium]
MDKTQRIAGEDNGCINSSDASVNCAGTTEELEKELVRLRRKDRRNMFILGLLSALMVAVGTVMYISKEADSALSPYIGGPGSNGQPGSYTSYVVGGSGANGSAASIPAGGSGVGGGGGCGGGGGGGCGKGGSLAGNVSLADLEKKAAVKYKEETGDSNGTAKATDYGCHIQIDIKDSKGNVVRSYGYQGGPLYVIK